MAATSWFDTTAALVSYRPWKHRLTVSYAGHPPGWILRRPGREGGGRRWERLTITEAVAEEFRNEHPGVRVRRLNRYVEERAPWQLAKDDAKRQELDVTLRSLAEAREAVARGDVEYGVEAARALVRGRRVS